MADDVLRQGIQGITELVTQPGMINVDFAHIRRMMQSGGGSLLSIGYGEGQHKAMQAVERALHHPLLESIPLENVTGIIANFTGGRDLAFLEVVEALTYLQAQTNNQADIIPGVINDERMENRVEVILVITGIGATPVDAASVKNPRAEKAATPAAAEPLRLARLHQPTAIELNGAQTDLDLPAFMRRRVR
jgi:cell division protein FtsZ